VGLVRRRCLSEDVEHQRGDSSLGLRASPWWRHREATRTEKANMRATRWVTMPRGAPPASASTTTTTKIEGGPPAGGRSARRRTWEVQPRPGGHGAGAGLVLLIYD
jgi:hypothetical protein